MSKEGTMKVASRQPAIYLLDEWLAGWLTGCTQRNNISNSNNNEKKSTLSNTKYHHLPSSFFFVLFPMYSVEKETDDDTQAHRHDFVVLASNEFLCRSDNKIYFAHFEHINIQVLTPMLSSTTPYVCLLHTCIQFLPL